MAKKYIDAGLLRKEIEYLKAVHIGHAAITKETNAVDGLDAALKVVDSLQQEQPDEVLIPRWCLENIENTLRIQHNINNDAKDGETCQDRNIKESLNCVRKLLNGEEITGLERLEPLTKQQEVDLEKAALNFGEEIGVPVSNTFMSIARHFYELGKLNARKEKKQ